MTRRAIESDKAKAVGPYSLGIEAGGFAFISGQTPLDPATGKLVEGDIAAQTRQCFRNLEAVLSAAGLGFQNVVKSTVFLVDMADFAAMNEVYKTFVSAPFPARSTIGVAALPLGARVEIELIAHAG
ncbi:MAG: RidA family protein [Hyphomicrobiaceae bacterium]|nr:RidA family protein [Hyphomicrobiaceae bacterium]